MALFSVVRIRKKRRRRAPSATLAECPARLVKNRLGEGSGRDLLGVATARVVREIRAKPALHVCERQPLAGGIVLDLVAADAADGEIPRLRMPQVDAAHARCRDHRARLRERDADVFGAEQLEELELLAVVRA